MVSERPDDFGFWIRRPVGAGLVPARHPIHKAAQGQALPLQVF